METSRVCFADSKRAPAFRPGLQTRKTQHGKKARSGISRPTPVLSPFFSYWYWGCTTQVAFALHLGLCVFWPALLNFNFGGAKAQGVVSHWGRWHFNTTAAAGLDEEARGERLYLVYVLQQSTSENQYNGRTPDARPRCQRAKEAVTPWFGFGN